jgi:ADP-ribose pyrophosphatase YjhB (NUDIX family)
MTKRGWLTDKEYEFVFDRTPRPCIDLVVETPRGIVLSKRAIEPYKGLWHLPGGRILHRESLAHAIERIAKAETGASVRVVRLLGPIEVFYDGPCVHSLSFAFLVRPRRTKLADSPQGHLEVFRRFPKPMHPYHRRFLRAQGFFT